MASQLGLYQGALRLLKHRRIASLSDNDPARYMLDDVYASALAYMLEQASWNFASYSTSIAGTVSANRGYAYRFTKPSDFVRLISISASSSYYPPLEAYDEDATYWYANVSTFYVTYVSDGASYGGNLSKWPETYARAVEAYLAMEIGPHVTNSAEILKSVSTIYDAALRIAIAKDGINRTVRVVDPGTLSVYNGALRLLGRRMLSNFDDMTLQRRIGTEKSPPSDDVEIEAILRRMLDESYDDALLYLLQQGLWNFGGRTVAIEAETDVEPEFGFSYTFEKPDDWVRLVAIADNGALWPTLDDYLEEGNYLHANSDLIYVQYVSSGAGYGGDISLWPPTFKKALQYYLAVEVAPHANVAAGKIELLHREFRRLLRDARGKDASDQAAMWPSPGRLVRARLGRGRSDQRRRSER